MKIIIAVFSLLLTLSVNAQQMSISFLGGITTATQDDVETLRVRADKRNGGISTPNLHRRPTIEVSGYWQYQFENSNLAFQVRPSYIFVDEDGMNLSRDRNYDYIVSGYTLFPMLKMYVYEKDTTRVFAQAGVGWGFVNLKITEGGAGLDASAMQMGSQIGAGAEFCVIAKNHCLSVEGSFRHLEFNRLEVDSVKPTLFNQDGSGTFEGISNGTLRVGGEVEIDHRDLRTSFSGFIGLVGYTYYFE